jgi:hypothetical protein
MSYAQWCRWGARTPLFPEQLEVLCRQFLGEIVEDLRAQQLYKVRIYPENLLVTATRKINLFVETQLHTFTDVPVTLIKCSRFSTISLISCIQAGDMWMRTCVFEYDTKISNSHKICCCTLSPMVMLFWWISHCQILIYHLQSSKEEYISAMTSWIL